MINITSDNFPLANLDSKRLLPWILGAIINKDFRSQASNAENNCTKKKSQIFKIIFYMRHYLQNFLDKSRFFPANTQHILIIRKIKSILR